MTGAMQGSRSSNLGNESVFLTGASIVFEAIKSIHKNGFNRFKNLCKVWHATINQLSRIVGTGRKNMKFIGRIVPFNLAHHIFWKNLN